MRFGLGAVTACLFFAALTTPASAWVELAQRNVADRTDHDTIVLPGGRMFNHIRLCVYRQPVHFIDVDVYFRNGGHQDVRVAERINAGRCTRAIDLEGGQRDIDHIALVYEETSFRRRTATVRLFAE